MCCFIAFLLGNAMTKDKVDSSGIEDIQSQVLGILEQYRHDLEVLNRSPKTISWYMENLSPYFHFLQLENLLKPVRELGREELKRYILYLHTVKRWPKNTHIKEENRGSLSEYSIQGRVRAIKAFWSYLLMEGHIEVNPLAKFPLPKVPRKLVAVITPERFVRLLIQIDAGTANGSRYYCILLLLFDNGSRISEVVKIKIDDIDFQNDGIRVMGKGQKERVVPISPFTRKQITRYINRFRGETCEVDSPYLFPDRDGEPISKNAVYQYVKRLAKKAGLDDVKCSPHILRHSFATHYLANGGDISFLKEVMGHESISTTLKYTHLQPQHFRKHHMQFSPIANLPLSKK